MTITTDREATLKVDQKERRITKSVEIDQLRKSKVLKFAPEKLQQNRKIVLKAVLQPQPCSILDSRRYGFPVEASDFIESALNISTMACAWQYFLA